MEIESVNITFLRGYFIKIREKRVNFEKQFEKVLRGSDDFPKINKGGPRGTKE